MQTNIRLVQEAISTEDSGFRYLVFQSVAFFSPPVRIPHRHRYVLLSPRCTAPSTGFQHGFIEAPLYGLFHLPYSACGINVAADGSDLDLKAQTAYAVAFDMLPFAQR